MPRGNSSPVSRRRFASVRSSRCSSSFQSMKRQQLDVAGCLRSVLLCARMRAATVGATDVLDSRLTRSKLDSASKKNSAKCLANSRRIEVLNAHMYARSSGCVYAAKFRCTQHSLMCRLMCVMLRNSFATCCGARSRTRRARVSAQRHQRARSCPCQSRRCRHLLVQKELSFVVGSLSIHSACCFRVSSRSSPVPSLAPM